MLNKKEQEEFELLKTKLALRFTEKVNYDIQPPPLFSSEILNGYRELPRKPRPLVAGMNWQNNLKKHLTNSKYDSILYM